MQFAHEPPTTALTPPWAACARVRPPAAPSPCASGPCPARQRMHAGAIIISKGGRRGSGGCPRTRRGHNRTRASHLLAVALLAALLVERGAPLLLHGLLLGPLGRLARLRAPGRRARAAHAGRTPTPTQEPARALPMDPRTCCSRRLSALLLRMALSCCSKVAALRSCAPQHAHPRPTHDFGRKVPCLPTAPHCSKANKASRVQRRTHVRLHDDGAPLLQRLAALFRPGRLQLGLALERQRRLRESRRTARIHNRARGPHKPDGAQNSAAREQGRTCSALGTCSGLNLRGARCTSRYKLSDSRGAPTPCSRRSAATVRMLTHPPPAADVAPAPAPPPLPPAAAPPPPRPPPPAAAAPPPPPPPGRSR